MKTVKPCCRYCGGKRGVLKRYIIADDMENPKLYHPRCLNNLYEDVMIELSNRNANTN